MSEDLKDPKLMEEFKKKTGNDPKEDGSLSEAYKEWAEAKVDDGSEAGKEELIETVEDLSEELERLEDDLDDFSNELDKSKAKINSLTGLRESYDSRLSMINERIGELRNATTEGEKERAEIKSKAERAIDLLEQAEPEALLKEVKKRSAEIDKVKGRMDAVEVKIETFTEQLQDIRRDIEKFSGIDEIMKRAEDVQKDISVVEELKSKVKQKSDRVIAIFNELRGKVKDIERNKADIDGLESRVDDNSTELTDLSVKIEGLPDVEEIQKRVARLEKKLLDEQKNVDSGDSDEETPDDNSDEDDSE